MQFTLEYVGDFALFCLCSRQRSPEGLGKIEHAAERVPAIAGRVQADARRGQTYDFIKSRRLQFPMSDADAGELDSKLAILKRRLQSLGEKFL